MSQPLIGKVAAITGASSGLGRHFARVLSNAGASVALMARRTDRLEAEVEAIRRAGGKAIAVALDVADAAAVGPALDRVEAEIGALSILVNNAGVSGAGSALDLDLADWDHAFAVNVRGVFVGAREAARRMIASGVAETGEARIINIASVAAFQAEPGLPAYCASKAACAHLTKSLALDWARKQIAVNALCPGYIETEINADWFATERGQRQVNSFPRKRLMPESALDEALLMLAGPSARYISGTLITIEDAQTL